MSNRSEYNQYNRDADSYQNAKEELKKIDDNINSSGRVTSEDLDRRDVLKTKIARIQETWPGCFGK